MSDADESQRPVGPESAFEALIRDVARTPAVSAHKRPGDYFANGRYRVERLLGRGGQKLVFLVHDTTLKRDCALSLVQPEQAAPSQLERFRQEAQALACFGAHANIVTIYDLGEEEGFPYVLCEFLQGGDLRAAMGENLSVPRALTIVRDVCRALAFAHERGVIHRDVTPGNIWLLQDGSAKLGDFGLALVAGESRLTTPGGVLGTAAYLAPEQAMGKAVDGRTDLYALGCVLYELLTGEPPFVGDSALAVVSQHLHADPVAPDVRNPAVGPKLSSLVVRLLAKRPADRPASARELVDEIERMLATSSQALVASGDEHPIPGNERERLMALHALGILDTPPEPAYDEIASLAAQLCGCPLAYICFVDETRQWMKANYQFPPELTSAPREIGICQTTICQSDVVVSCDLAEDERFRHLPPVAQPPHLRFYCGAPLITPRGHALGTLVVMDFEPRELSSDQIEVVRRLSRQVVAQLELVHTSIELERRNRDLDDAHREVESARNRAVELMSRMIPEHLLGQVDDSGRLEPRYHDCLTVGFVRVSDFEGLAASVSPAQLVAALDELHSVFDEVTRQHGVDKIKTLGGTYVFAAGLSSTERHADRACLAALALQRAVAAVNQHRAKLRLPRLNVQIGLHTGPAMAGTIGRWKLSFDLWGQTVSLAARLAAAAEPDQVTISEVTYDRVKERFECAARGSVELESRGSLATFAVAATRDTP